MTEKYPRLGLIKISDILPYRVIVNTDLETMKAAPSHGNSYAAQPMLSLKSLKLPLSTGFLFLHWGHFNFSFLKFLPIFALSYICVA